MTALNRINEWPEALSATVDAYRSRPHEWGRSDCCQFAAECILAMTGTDLREQFQPYADEDEAQSIIEDCGGVAGLVSLVLGDPKHVSRAQVGDVVAYASPEGESVGICLGVNTVSMNAAAGKLVYWPTLRGIAAWSV